MGGATAPGLLVSVVAGVKGVLNQLFGTDTVTLTPAHIPTISGAATVSGTLTGSTTPGNVARGISGSSTGGGQFGINTIIDNGNVGVSVSGTLNGSWGYSNGSTPTAHNNIQPSRVTNFIIRLA